jgi:hypothetical protein
MDEPISLRAFAAKCRILTRFASPLLTTELVRLAEGAERRAKTLEDDEHGSAIRSSD